MFDSKDFDYIGENTEKYISFVILSEVDLKDKNGEAIKKKNKKVEEFEVNLTKTCKLRFIDIFRFMPSSLSSLIDNLVGTNQMILSVKIVKRKWNWWKLMLITYHILSVKIAIHRLNRSSLMGMY